MEIRFSMNGAPRGKGSVRHTVRKMKGNWIAIPYKDTVDREYESSMRGLARKAMGDRPPMKGPLRASFRFRLPVPKSYSNKQRARILLGDEGFLGNYDLSNMIKAVEDAMSTVVYDDDKQITTYGFALKVAHETPGIDVIIEALSPQ